jgi:hypothetical protein
MRSQASEAADVGVAAVGVPMSSSWYFAAAIFDDLKQMSMPVWEGDGWDLEVPGTGRG